MMRLDKFLADAGAGSRSQVKEYIKKGLVRVNEEVVKKPEYKLKEETDQVYVKNEKICYQQFHYYMMNKPEGVLSATEDRREKTVLDLMEDIPKKNLFPVGRLDKDVEGLLLITDDGELAHRMLAPKYHVDKTYYIKANGILTEKEIKKLEEGVDIGEDRLTLPAKVKMLSASENESELLLTIHEGKFHQVKKMMEAVGRPLTKLKRLSMGNLQLDEGLKPGTFRELTSEEREKLLTYKK